MIIGGPGSGKHEIVARFLLLARKMKKKVLVMGINNQSIDNLALRLLYLQEKFADKFTDSEKTKIVRVSSNTTQINKKLKPFVNSCASFNSLKELDSFIKEHDVFFATATSVFNTFFGCFNFDFCILDEASLITEPLSIGPILMADKFIMIGDYYILNPCVKNNDADKRGLSISLFRKLSEKYPYDVVLLKKQYRMNDHICSLTNVIAYKGLIKHGSDEVKEATFHFDETRDFNSYPFIKEIKCPERKVVFINTDNLLNKAWQKQLNSMKNRNFYEGAIVSAIVDNFL
jgi:DNA replication ATP-dependent helicase Dna2